MRLGKLGLFLTLILSVTTYAGDTFTGIPTEYDFSYTDTFSNLGSVRFNVRSRVGTDDHVAWSWYACPENTDCLAGGPIKFVIPKSFIHSWDAFDAHYEIIGTRAVRVLGQQTSVTLIKATHPKFQTLYVYSTNRGLLGFQALGVAGAPFFWLEEKCGFGARNCH